MSKEEEYLNPKKTITSRRLRLNPEIRKIFKETTLNVDNFIAPIFVCFGENKKIPIETNRLNFSLLGFLKKFIFLIIFL